MNHKFLPGPPGVPYSYMCKGPCDCFNCSEPTPLLSPRPKIRLIVKEPNMKTENIIPSREAMDL
jgi:hypothetical protein